MKNSIKITLLFSLLISLYVIYAIDKQLNPSPPEVKIDSKSEIKPISDSEIKKLFSVAKNADIDLRRQQVELAINNGDVTLRGVAEKEKYRDKLIDLAKMIPGVKKVSFDMSIEFPEIQNPPFDPSTLTPVELFPFPLLDKNTYKLKWGYIDKSGKEVIEPRFDEARRFYEGLAAIQMEGKWGFIDKTGSLVILPKIDSAVFKNGYNGNISSGYFHSGNLFKKLEIDFSEGMACATFLVDSKSRPKKYKFGFIDRKGNFVIEPTFNSVAPFSEGLGTVSYIANGKTILGYIDRNGKILFEPPYDCVSLFNEGIATVGNNYVEKYKNGSSASFGCLPVTYIDKTGKITINPVDLIKGFSLEDRHISNFSDGLAAITKGFFSKRYTCYINKRGEVVIPWIENYVDSFHEGLARFQFESRPKYGFIDKTGKVAIEPIFEQALSFSEGLAGVAVKDKWGYIDKTGNLVIEPTFAVVSNFYQGLALVLIGDNLFNLRYAYIDKTGKIIWQQNNPSEPTKNSN